MLNLRTLRERTCFAVYTDQQLRKSFISVIKANFTMLYAGVLFKATSSQHSQTTDRSQIGMQNISEYISTILHLLQIFYLIVNLHLPYFK